MALLRLGSNDRNGARDGYIPMCGTSMATPVAAGTGALISEQWKRLHSNRIQPSMMKGILIQTARDLGTPGPDFQFGWGKLDANMAVNYARLDDNLRSLTRDTRAMMINGIVDAGSTNTYVIPSQGINDIKITMTWDDPPATRLATRTLVNNLNLRLIDPHGTIHSPFLLNPSSPNNQAVTGVDNINNVEMVIGNRERGIWRVIVDGLGVSQGPQIYSLIGSDGMTNLRSVRPHIQLTQAVSGTVPGTGNRQNLLGIPLPVTTSSSISFSFTGSSDYGIARFECRLNSDPIEVCGNAGGHITETGTSTFRSLSGGQNTFSAIAVDTLGKRASATFGWHLCAGTRDEVDMCLSLHEATRQALFTGIVSWKLYFAYGS